MQEHHTNQQQAIEANGFAKQAQDMEEQLAELRKGVSKAGYVSVAYLTTLAKVGKTLTNFKGQMAELDRDHARSHQARTEMIAV